MLYDGLIIAEGATITNPTLPSGTEFPNTPTTGELYYHTGQQAVCVYDGTAWTAIGTGGTVDFNGLNVKAAVRAATTANIALSGVQTIDGVSLVAGDRVLVKNQTTASQNGVYVVAAGTWARAADFDGSPLNEVKAGDFCFVTEGTAYADTGWVLNTNGAITIGTTAISFVQFTGGTALTPPAGANGQIQYNGSGDFAASSLLTWNNSASTLTIGSSSVSSSRIVLSANGPTSIIPAGGTASDLTIQAGQGPGTQAGGDLVLAAGLGGTSTGGGNAGSNLILAAGTRGGLDGWGGYISIRGGNAAAPVEQIRILNTGALSFGSSGTATGSAGQVLTSNGANASPSWQTISAATLGGNNTFTGTNAFNGQVSFTSTVSAGGSVGTLGQVLTSNGVGTAPSWKTVSFSGAGLGDNNTFTGTNTFSGAVTLSAPVTLTSQLVVNSSSGTAGQVLTSGGAAGVPTWQTLPQAASTTVTNVSAAATTTLNCSLGSTFNISMGADITTLAFSNVPTGQYTMTVFFTQDSVGGRAITWPASIKWPGAATPLLTSTGTRTDIYNLTTIDGGTTWFGTVVGINF